MDIHGIDVDAEGRCAHWHSDKPLSFADLGEEENPALGRRGLRLSQAREDLLDT